MTASLERTGRRFAIVPALASAIGVLILIGLGVWQVQRLHWKEGILARVAALEHAEPTPLAPLLARAAAGGDVDYHRVALGCPGLEHTPVLRLYTVTDAGPGYRIITSCPVAAGPYRSILVDRGVVGQATDVAQMPAAPGALTEPLVGVLRQGDRPNLLTPKNEPVQNQWFWRDIPAMARALGAEAPAPTFLMLERPSAPPGGPTPAAVPSDIPNNHLQYAITWFGLAVALAAFYLASLRTKRPRG